MAAAVLISAGTDFEGATTLFAPMNESFLDYSSKSIEVPFDSTSLNFGSLSYATIPKKDDIVKKVTLKTTLGPLYKSTTDGWVYPIYSSNILPRIWDPVTNTQVITAVPLFPYYNTQTFNEWIQGSYYISYNGTLNSFVISYLTQVAFESESSASFFGFDITLATLGTIEGGPDVYIFDSVIPQFNLFQSGWIQGFQPPPTNAIYYDSVGDRVVSSASLLIGGQVIQTLSSNVLITEQDIDVPLENQGPLTILVGKNDTQSVVSSRTYWTNLSFDTIPMSSLYNQDVQIRVQFEDFQNLTGFSLLGGVLNGSAYSVNTVNIPSPYSPVVGYQKYLVYVGYSSSGTVGLVTFDGTQYVVAPIAPEMEPGHPFGPVINLNYIYFASSFNTPPAFRLCRGEANSTQVIVSTFDLTSFGYGNINSLLPTADHIYIICENGIIVYTFSVGDINTSEAYTPFGYTFIQARLDLGVDFYFIYENAVLFVNGACYLPVYTASNNTYLLQIDLSTPTHMRLYQTPQNVRIQKLVSDGTYIYFSIGNIFDTITQYSAYRFHSTNGQYEQGFYSVIYQDLECLLFDGRFIYYMSYYTYDSINPIIVLYDTTMDFASTYAWSWIQFYPDGKTINSNGISSQSIPIHVQYPQLILTNQNISMIDGYRGAVYFINPNIVTPTIQSSLIVDYAHYENPVTDIVQPVKQNQVNIFTVRAGLIQDIFNLTFQGPVKEFWIETSGPVMRLTLELNGEILFDEDYSSIYNLRPFESHVITPSRPVGIYSFNPGSLNISRFTGATLTVIFSSAQAADTLVYVYSRAVNVLACSGGVGNLMFN